MIARSQRKIEPESWQRELREAWTDPLAMLAQLGVEPAHAGFDSAAVNGFPFRVPRAYAALIRPGDAIVELGWVDGAGKPFFQINPDSKASWEEQKDFLGGLIRG